MSRWGGEGGEIRGRRMRLTTKANAEIQYRGDHEFIAKVKSDGRNRILVNRTRLHHKEHDDRGKKCIERFPKTGSETIR